MTKIKSQSPEYFKNDIPITRMAFLLVSFFFVITVASAIVTRSASIGVQTAVYALLYALLNIHLVYSSWGNRSFRSASKKLALSLIVIWALIIFFAYRMVDNIPRAIFINCMYLLCSFLTVKLHESTVMAQKDVSQAS
jgi:hypothetical protein